VSTAKSATVFGVAALVTLVAGVVLERSGDVIAGDIGLSGVLFGATVLAAATSLPELSTGLTSVRQGDYQLAVSDIFGGNAFLPVLFLLATLLSGKAVLPRAQDSDIYLTAVAMLLTLVYAAGLVFRPRRRLGGMGIDSLVVLVLYALGLLGLFAISVAG
jgi:cation:H+ antiporter